MEKNLGSFLAGLMLLFFIGPVRAQQDTLVSPADTLRITGVETLDTITDITAPSKAAFYSAVLPGLGQAYNKQYWKIPIVYLFIGGSAYIYYQNQQEYLRFRKAYQYRLLGLPDEFPQYSLDILVTAQNYYRRNRDLAFMATILMYALNIIDANVSAHLKQWNIDDKLTFSFQPGTGPSGMPGASIRISF